MNISLGEIAAILGINSNKSINIEGLDYYYYNSNVADVESIVAYYEDARRYTYLTVSEFMYEHGFENISDIKELV